MACPYSPPMRGRIQKGRRALLHIPYEVKIRPLRPLIKAEKRTSSRPEKTKIKWKQCHTHDTHKLTHEICVWQCFCGKNGHPSAFIGAELFSPFVVISVIFFGGVRWWEYWNSYNSRRVPCCSHHQITPSPFSLDSPHLWWIPMVSGSGVILTTIWTHHQFEFSRAQEQCGHFTLLA